MLIGWNPWYIRTYTTGMTKHLIFTVLIMFVITFYNSNKAPLGFVVYGQYSAAKGCLQTLRVASYIRTALSRGILAIYHTPHTMPYCLKICHLADSFIQITVIRAYILSMGCDLDLCCSTIFNNGFSRTTSWVWISLTWIPLWGTTFPFSLLTKAVYFHIKLGACKIGTHTYLTKLIMIEQIVWDLLLYDNVLCCHGQLIWNNLNFLSSNGLGWLRLCMTHYRAHILL